MQCLFTLDIYGNVSRQSHPTSSADLQALILSVILGFTCTMVGSRPTQSLFSFVTMSLSLFAIDMQKPVFEIFLLS